MTTADEAWSQLGPHFQQAMHHAWESFRGNNLGIGAVLVDPATDQIVSTGRNAVNAPTDQDLLSGNFMAHAEMNAFAVMASYKAVGLHLYSTLEPCLMCAATAVFLHVDTVHVLAADEFFGDLDDLWEQHPYSKQYRPKRTGPRPGKITSFARLLPLSRQASDAPNARPMFVARQQIPGIAALADELCSGELDELARTHTEVSAAIAALWADLPDDA